MSEKLNFLRLPGKWNHRYERGIQSQGFFNQSRIVGTRNYCYRLLGIIAIEMRVSNSYYCHESTMEYHR